MATYLIQDIEDGYLYTDKLCIKVLDLTQLEAEELALDNEKASGSKKVKIRKLIKWAKIFKAETLENLEKLTQGEEVFESMVFTIKKLNEDEKLRMQCEAREDYERCLKSEYNAGFREGQALEKQRADEAVQKADEAAQRADEEKQRADEEKQRADEAEAEVQRLKKLLMIE